MSFTTKSNTTEETLIPIGTASQIKVRSFKVELTTTTANTVTIRQGTAGAIIDKFVLTTQGDVKGFVGCEDEYILDNSLTIECSASQTINIYYNAELI